MNQPSTVFLIANFYEIIGESTAVCRLAVYLADGDAIFLFAHL